MEWVKESIPYLNKHEYNMCFDDFVEETEGGNFDAMDLTQFKVLLTGKTITNEKVGWIVSFVGCSSQDIFNGEIALKVERNLFPEHRALAEIGKVYKTLTLTHFRRVAFPISDTMSFENTSFIIIEGKRRLARLARILPFLTLPLLRTELIPFFKENDKKETKKKRSYKKTYRKRATKSLKLVHKKVDRLILTYQKSICDIERTIKCLKRDLNSILNERLESVERVKERNKRREMRKRRERKEMEDIPIELDQIIHLLDEEESENTIKPFLSKGFTLLHNFEKDFEEETQKIEEIFNKPPEFFF